VNAIFVDYPNSSAMRTTVGTAVVVGGIGTVGTTVGTELSHFQTLFLSYAIYKCTSRAKAENIFLCVFPEKNAMTFFVPAF
jgi:hypothetical protein